MRLAAFLGDRLRGLAEAQVVGGVAQYFLTVQGDGAESGEPLRYRVLHPSSGLVYPVSPSNSAPPEASSFSPGQTVGSVATPVRLDLPDTALPVELTHFSAVLDDGMVVLRWETANEVNNAGFDIEVRMNAAADFERVGFVGGAGTTIEAQSYSFRMRETAPGRYSFRLKQVDYDGAFAYSPVLEVDVEVDAPAEMSAAFPNPSASHVTLEFVLREARPVRLALYDVLGRRVGVAYEGSPGASVPVHVLIDASDLPSGVYVASLETRDGYGLGSPQRILIAR
jgi:hypothetical protein